MYVYVRYSTTSMERLSAVSSRNSLIKTRQIQLIQSITHLHSGQDSAVQLCLLIIFLEISSVYLTRIPPRQTKFGPNNAFLDKGADGQGRPGCNSNTVPFVIHCQNFLLKILFLNLYILEEFYEQELL